MNQSRYAGRFRVPLRGFIAVELHHCKVYASRLGVQKTVSGKTFTCVDIRDNIKKGAVYDGCAYI